MPRYIDADLLLKKLSRMIDYCQSDSKVNAVTALFQVGDAIMDCKTADVAEVKHGEWDDSFDGITPYCSCCGQSHSCMKRTPSYCPNCGAKMSGGET